ncbi:MAG: PAS domain-containing protein [Pseudomonadota bacterium]
MDSTRRERRFGRSPVQRLRSLWRPFLWVPMLVLVAGLTVTGFTARLIAEHTRDLAEQAYHAQHQALINRLHASATASAPRDQPEEWLASVFPQTTPNLLTIRVDTLERHSKTPVFQTGSARSLDGAATLRTEVSLPGHHWLVTTVPDPTALNATTDKARLATWLAGAAITAIGMALTLLLCARIHGVRTQLDWQQGAAEKLEQQLANSQVEKSILRQALNDSEQRSRDLVALSGAIIGELDEQGCIGFVSAEVAEWLELAPADLAGTRFDELVSPHYRTNFQRTLEEARAQKTLQRIDLDLLPADPEAHAVPVTLRVLALRDPLHGFIGYRVSARPGHA